jgi:hypothetical protein
MGYSHSFQEVAKITLRAYLALVVADAWSHPGLLPDGVTAPTIQMANHTSITLVGLGTIYR